MPKKSSKTEVSSVAANKQEMADLVISQIRSTYGKGSIMKMDEQVLEDIEVISTGSLAVDLATGIGGLPKGRIVEVYGPESSGKTSLALSTIAQAQKAGGIAAFIDAEHAFDPSWAQRFGVNVSDLYLSQPSNGEEALEITETLVRSNAFDILVIDSVAALVPKSEIEGNMGDSSMGVQARLMSQALRKLTAIINKSNTVVIFINQIRLKIGVMFGNPETTTGGQALKFYASQRFEVRKAAVLKNGTEQVGIRVKVKLVKNKMAPPFQVAEIDLLPGQKGVFNLPGEILDYGLNYGVVGKSGNTYSLLVNEKIESLDEKNAYKLGVGRAKAVETLLESRKLVEAAKTAITNRFNQQRFQKQAELTSSSNSSDVLNSSLTSEDGENFENSNSELPDPEA